MFKLLNSTNVVLGNQSSLHDHICIRQIQMFDYVRKQSSSWSRAGGGETKATAYNKSSHYPCKSIDSRGSASSFYLYLCTVLRLVFIYTSALLAASRQCPKACCWQYQGKYQRRCGLLFTLLKMTCAKYFKFYSVDSTWYPSLRTTALYNHTVCNI